ncbi:nucleotide exchange factor GrpE [Argonema antarcticum]|uniref:nucleotide exchange factor GrpE n=1 Tax=Argonema antarcticum TaxID=2942763 RepID=UPI002013B0D1|nr:nucleotide exchange factor GrpE [Argonema antarcticum]MCL1472427.1 nucleotide exchange factor GrpE [Argonema antarcticum A004/B2]
MMVNDPNLFWFGCVLWLVIIWLIVSLRHSNKVDSPTESNTAGAREIEELRQECLRLREELQMQSKQLKTDFQNATFSQLQTLLNNYPSVRKMTEAKPDLPAKNLVSLFTSLDNLLASWGYEQIGSAWEQVPYNPQLHQPDTNDIAEGELVYIRFVGYREGSRILSPAKVSRTLPISSPSK